MSPQLAREIAARGSLDAAIACLHNDECHDLLGEALRVRSAAEEAADPALKARRLRVAAADLDYIAERHMAAAADAAGRGAGRRLRWGEDELTRSFDREELACTQLAAEIMAEASEKRLAASRLESRVAERDTFAELVRAVLLSPAAEVVAHLAAAE